MKLKLVNTLKNSLVFIVFKLVSYSLKAQEYALKEVWESGKADICLVELVQEVSKLSPAERKALSFFCYLPLPKKPTVFKATELEIFFYQAGLYPAKIRQDVKVIPKLRPMTASEAQKWGLVGQEILLPAEAEVIAYRPPQSELLELRLVGRRGQFYTWHTVTLPAVKRLLAGAPVTLRWENATMAIEILGHLAHTATIGERVIVKSGGRNFTGILVDKETVVPELP